MGFRMGGRWMMLMPLLVLAACAEQPPGASVPGRTASRIPPQSFAPGLDVENARANEAQLTNDPSAPVDTPLCGVALKEEALAGGAVYGDGLATNSPCTRNACFQPLTGTFIAASGARSVCR